MLHLNGRSEKHRIEALCSFLPIFCGLSVGEEDILSGHSKFYMVWQYLEYCNVDYLFMPCFTAEPQVGLKENLLVYKCCQWCESLTENSKHILLLYLFITIFYYYRINSIKLVSSWMLLISRVTRWKQRIYIFLVWFSLIWLHRFVISL